MTCGRPDHLEHVPEPVGEVLDPLAARCRRWPAEGIGAPIAPARHPVSQTDLDDAAPADTAAAPREGRPPVRGAAGGPGHHRAAGDVNRREPGRRAGVTARSDGPERRARRRAAGGPAVAVVPTVVVDDHQLVGSSLAASLRAEGLDARFHPVRSAPGVLASAPPGRPGLVILDLELGRDETGARIDGVSLVAPLCAARWWVLLLVDRPGGDLVGAALAAGASGWVPKTAPLPTLVAAISDTVTGRPVNAPARREQLIELHHRRERERDEVPAGLARLTAREREVLALMAAGHRARAIAEQFVVSVATVRTQIRAVLTKLEVGSQLEAVAVYARAGAATVPTPPPRPPRRT